MSSNLLDFTVDYSLFEGINKDFLEEHKIYPVHSQQLSVLIATSNKTLNEEEFVKIFDKPVKFLFVEGNELKAELQYLDLKKELYLLGKNALSNKDRKDENSYIINFMDILFSFCIVYNASDIHFESANESVIIRLRIDGELIQIFRFDKELFSLISSIIKYFGNLDISQKRIPLNGRFSRKINKLIYDMRISTMPTIYGESIVLRILDNGNIKKDILTIGFERNTLQCINKNIRVTQGLILVTGPTGSGKTTSLYSMINSLNTKNKKIITIEDPVEYKLDGVMQVNINEEIHLDYQLVLKNILRQDPDILLIGEIRDKESLQIAIQASLTGHLVIATLHTNNAIETITRLIDLEAEPYLIASTLKMVLSQRLVRVLCPHCKVKSMTTNSYEHKGCTLCNFTGYKGRKIVSEVLEVDEQIAKMISRKSHMDEIVSYANTIGFTSLKENGLQLVDAGITTLDEFYSKI
ncbi:MAG: GspE/PulE family protein [Arcobacteraceae bacterium]